MLSFGVGGPVEAEIHQARGSYPLINKEGEVRRSDQELSPLRVEVGCRSGGDGLVQRSALLLESGYIFANCHQHFAKLCEARPVADRSMSRNDDRLIAGERGEGFFGRANLPIYAAAGGVVDKRVNAVPPDVPNLNDVGIWEVNPKISVGMGR